MKYYNPYPKAYDTARALDNIARQQSIRQHYLSVTPSIFEIFKLL